MRLWSPSGETDGATDFLDPAHEVAVERTHAMSSRVPEGMAHALRAN